VRGPCEINSVLRISSFVVVVDNVIDYPCKKKYNLNLNNPLQSNSSSVFTTIANRNIGPKTTSSKELVTSNSKSDICYKPNIYALKEEGQKKNKRPVSAYVGSSAHPRNFKV
jgi:hypothetical protein